MTPRAILVFRQKPPVKYTMLSANPEKRREQVAQITVKTAIKKMPKRKGTMEHIVSSCTVLVWASLKDLSDIDMAAESQRGKSV